MSASENSEIVRKLRRVADGNLPEWAQLPITMPEVRTLLLLVDTITDLRKNEKVRARLIRERNADLATLRAKLDETKRQLLAEQAETAKLRRQLEVRS